jgi:hypothetical protein
MNKLSEPSDDREVQMKALERETSASSTNLVLIYALIALALVTAIGLAVLIVLPFYHRR